mmetsp:Transcript_33869/g.66033  ORF Transcript_33869/g.66033 Transcript_33869/m.66033 type:complete len:216 (+) Transcript_33869:285-932(+)
MLLRPDRLGLSLVLFQARAAVGEQRLVVFAHQGVLAGVCCRHLVVLLLPHRLVLLLAAHACLAHHLFLLERGVQAGCDALLLRALPRHLLHQHGLATLRLHVLMRPHLLDEHPPATPVALLASKRLLPPPLLHLLHVQLALLLEHGARGHLGGEGGEELVGGVGRGLRKESVWHVGVCLVLDAPQRLLEVVDASRDLVRGRVALHRVLAACFLLL